MKKFLSCVWIALGMSACGDQPTANSAYRVIEKTGEITAAELSGLKAQSLAVYGDTLLIVGRDSLAQSGLFLYSRASGKILAQLRSWDQGKTTFAGGATCVAVDSGRIYVGDKDSRVDVFDRLSLEHLSTVGSGVWWGEDSIKMVHSFGLGAMDSLLWVRDKSNLRVFAKSQITPEKSWKVPLYAKSVEMSTNTSHHNLVSDGKWVWLTDAGAHKLYRYARAAFQRGKMDLSPDTTIELDYAPYGLALVQGELWISGASKGLEIRNSQGDMVRSMPEIESYRWENTGALVAQGSFFAVVEVDRGSVILGQSKSLAVEIK